MAKVLLVEDDNNLREIYEARLQAEGYEISSAQDGEQALVVAKDFKPDLIISDVMMPKISGFEMLDILRNTAGLEHTRVIMLTALGQAEDKQRADSLGADRYLVKSQVTLEDIIKAAHDILDGDSGATPPATPTSEPSAAAVATQEINVATAPEPAPAETAPVMTDTPVAEAPVADLATPEPAIITEPMAVPAPPVDEPAVAPADPTTTAEPVAPAEPASEPVAAPEPAPVADATPPPTISAPSNAMPVQNDTDTPTPDDQLLAEAATSLGADTAADTPAPTPEAPVATDESEESGGSSKRVIHPIDSQEAKPTLAELLAREEGKEGENGPVATPAPVVDAVQAMETPPTPPSAGGIIAPTTAETPPEAPQSTEAGQKKKPDEFNPHDISL